MHRTFHNLAKKYGPIFSLRFGSRLVVVVSSASAAEECFTKNDIVFANRPKLLLGKHIGYNNTTLTLAPYGDHWRNLRRITTIEVFSSIRLNMFLPIRRDETKRLLEKLSRSSSQGGFFKVELKTMFSELTFNIMMRMVAGKRYYGDDVEDEEEARRFRKIMKEATSYGGASNPRDFLPILNWIDGGDFTNKLVNLSKRIDEFLQGLIDEHRIKKAGLESTNTMIDHLLSLQESQPEYYTDQIIKGLIMVMLLAGTETFQILAPNQIIKTQKPPTKPKSYSNSRPSPSPQRATSVLHRTLQALSEKHSSVFSLRFVSRNVIVVSSSSAAEECVNKNYAVFANRPRLIMGKYLGYNNTTITLSPYGDHWRNLRRLSAVEIFSSSRLNMFLGGAETDVYRVDVYKAETDGN
ncbi:hypothetical protein Q3G72_009297 [Acer saccharum]|nr:hypothetical protein Q3G72_009297 [Acer saccharum]